MTYSTPACSRISAQGEAETLCGHSLWCHYGQTKSGQPEKPQTAHLYNTINCKILQNKHLSQIQPYLWGRLLKSHYYTFILSCNFMQAYYCMDCNIYLPQVHQKGKLSDQRKDYMTLQCHNSLLANNCAWKKVNWALRGCGVLSSTWTGPKHRSVGYHGQCHKHPALAGLSQTEGVTQKTAVRLTSVGSNQTQPVACQYNPTEPFSFSAWSYEAFDENNTGLFLKPWGEYDLKTVWKHVHGSTCSHLKALCVRFTGIY